MQLMRPCYQQKADPTAIAQSYCPAATPPQPIPHTHCPELLPRSHPPTAIPHTHCPGAVKCPASQNVKPHLSQQTPDAPVEEVAPHVGVHR